MSPSPAAGHHPDPAAGYGLWILGVALASVGPDLGRLLADVAHVSAVVTSLLATASLGLSLCDRHRSRFPGRGRPRSGSTTARTRIRS